jgi:hypothetical protein
MPVTRGQSYSCNYIDCIENEMLGRVALAYMRENATRR